MRGAAMHEDHTALPTLELDQLALGRQRQQLMQALFGLETGARRLEHYELLRELGRGAMGVVYAAHDHKLDREVALKTLANTGDPELRRRLVIEAQAMAKLAHPNVVPIHEIGEAEGTIFIVMDRVEGVSLSAWLEQDARTPAQILAVFMAAGQGLAAAHAKGIVHRDFKPDNVMVGDDGRVQVMDFGVARSSGRAQAPAQGEPDAQLDDTQWALTRAGALVGTPAYMAPEQLRGGAADRASDQFSFCVALYEALYGARPFPAANLAALREAVERAQLNFPSEVPVPAWLRTLLTRGLAASPQARFASMDALLEAMRAGEAAREPPASLYLAHAEADTLEMRTLGELLLGEGLRCWLRTWEGDADADADADAALRDSPALLLCCGPHGWPAHQRATIDARIAADPSSVWSLRVGPHCDAPLPPGWPAPLVGAGARLERDDPALRALIASVGTMAARDLWLAEEAARASCEPHAFSPYRGLRPFAAADARWMFGREAQLAQLLGRLRDPGASRFSCVVGASGSGKSSLVHAGLGPLLRAAALGPSPRWAIASLRPGAHPCEVLARALIEWGGSAPAPVDAVEALAADLRAAPRSFKRELEQVAEARARARGPAHNEHFLLIIDQLEELFTLAELGQPGPSGAAAAAFVEAIVRATRDPATKLWVVATLRADFIPRCLEQRTLARVLHAGTYLALPPMTKAEIRAAVELPAARVGYSLEPALVSELISAAAEQPGRLPVLQHLLRELWQRRERDTRTLRLRDYLAAGGLEGALASAANSALEALRPALGERCEDCVRRVMTRLVQPAERHGTHTRRRASRAELGEDAETSLVLASFVDEARVLVASREGGVEVFELAHEALLHEWSLLREWLEADSEAITLRERLSEAAHDYAIHEDPEYLWGEGRVQRAEQIFAASTITLVEAEREFLARSHAHAHTRASQRRAALAALALVLLGLSALSAYLALEYRRAREASRQLDANAAFARQRANSQRSAQRGLQASLLASGHMDLQPLLLAIEALAVERGSGESPAPEAYRGALDVLAMDAVLGPVAHFDGHSRALSDLALSPDGARLATASLDGSARIWSATSGESLALLDEHGGPVSALAFSPDGARLATASWDRRVRIWDARDGRLLSSLPGHDAELRALAFSPDGTRLASASADSSARLWLLQPDGARVSSTVELRGHGAELSSLAFSPNGRYLVTTSLDASARIWDARSGALRHVLLGHASRVLGASFSPDSTSVITHGYESTARLWSVASGEQVRSFEGHRSSVTAAAFSPAGSELVTASFDDSARLWEVSSGELLTRFEGHSDDVLALAFVGQGDATRLLTASADASARLWDLRSGESLATASGHTDAVVALAPVPAGATGLRFATASADASARVWSLDAPPLPPATISTRGATLHALEYGPDGDLISASADGSVRSWDPTTGRRGRAFAGHTGEVLALAISPDGSRLASAGTDTSVRLWDARSGESLARFEGHESHVVDLAFSPDGRALASASLDGTAKLWGTLTHEQLANFSGHRSQVVALDFSDDGQRIATASYDGDVRVWDVQLDVPLALLEGHRGRVVALEFSPGAGARIATASHDRGVHLWDAAKGTRIARLAGHEDAVVALAYSPDGSQLASASADGSVRIWDVRGALVHVLEGHGAPLVALAWSPDGTLLASASLDDSVRLWEPAKGRLRGVMPTPGDPTSLRFSPEGHYLVSATSSGLIAQWPTPAMALRLACARAAPHLALAGARVAAICDAG